MLTRTKKLAYLATRMTWSCIVPRRIVGIGNQGRRFGFCEAKWNREEFSKKLEKEINDLEGSIQQSDPESQAYFKNHGWNIRYIPEKILFQFSKIDGGYDVRVLTHVQHTPPNSTTNGEPLPQQEAEDPNKRLNYSQAKIFIKKEGADKWLTAEMAIFDGSVELLTLNFTQEEPSFDWAKTEYSGPQISSLPEEVANGLNMIFKQFGITPEILMNIVIHSSSKVQELDITWLKNLKEIWT